MATNSEDVNVLKRQLACANAEAETWRQACVALVRAAKRTREDIISAETTDLLLGSPGAQAALAAAKAMESEGLPVDGMNDDDGDVNPRFPFAMGMLDVATDEVLTCTTGIRIVGGHSDFRFPHGVETYSNRANEAGLHSMHWTIESRHCQRLSFGLYNRQHPEHSSAKCFEDLIAMKDVPTRLNFNVALVYDDNLESVTVPNLSQRAASSIPNISEPPIIGTASILMHEGRVQTPKFHLKVLSSMTYPKNRKFRYVLTCENDFEHANKLTVKSRAFYCKGRLSTQ